MLVLLERQVRHHDGATATVPQPEAELDVRDPVELEPRVESLQRLRVGAAEGHAVALDRVHVRTPARGELLWRPLAAQAVRPGHHDGRIGQRLDERRDGVTRQIHARVEEDDHLARRCFDACVDRCGESQRRLEPDHARVARVVHDEGFEVGLAVSEDGEQPPFGVRLPAVHDREQRDRPRSRGRRRDGRRLQRLELASVGAVHDVPPTRVQPVAESVGRFEVLVHAEPYTLAQQAFGLSPIHGCGQLCPFGRICSQDAAICALLAASLAREAS